MQPKKKSSKSITSRAVTVVIAVIFMGAGVAFVKMLLMGDMQKRKPETTSVTLLKPPPPPPPKEKPPEPEPEIKKEKKTREEILDAGPEKSQPQAKDAPQNDKPMGKDLGIDADGGAGSDGFGLLGRKGGADIIGGGGLGGGSGLMRKYGWYTQTIQDDIRKRLQKALDQDGVSRKDKVTTLVKIILNESGTVVDFRILNSSGDPKVDKAVRQVLERLTLREPPPEGMPRSLNIKVSSKG